MEHIRTGEKAADKGDHSAFRMAAHGNVSFMRLLIEKDGAVPEHSSDMFLMVYVARGAVEYISRGKMVICGEGEMITDEPGNIHAIKNVYEGRSELVIVKIGGGK